jgi:hypothetical protein
MIKIKVTEIEVNKQEFTEKVNELCGDLHRYLGIVYLTRERFNDHFETNLNDLQFAKLMDDNCFETVKGIRVDIVKLIERNIFDEIDSPAERMRLKNVQKREK